MDQVVLGDSISPTDTANTANIANTATSASRTKDDYEYKNGELPPRNDTVGWVDPRLNGGRLLDFTTQRLGEPLNVIITSESDPFVLTEAGFHIYSKSIGFSTECLGLHYGHLHEANLGDGLGRKQEHYLARQAYFPIAGTCWESVRGGHHFRAWRQNGTLADSGAWFVGCVFSFFGFALDSSRNHKIDIDGYNKGRDYLVERAISGSHYNGMWWKAEVEWREGLMQRGKKGVNHGIPTDGRVAILTVHRL
ncbi:hypothetical protein K474DRAFT_1591997 [Panus rudis PR-1116 ss-1]|nr:hypothetical protein K474DRAFT_1591997 [Panus rudis PR-1116 ss-1]